MARGSRLTHFLLGGLGLFLGAIAQTGTAQACGDASPCAVETGRYYVKTPAGWDGITALPLAVHFHGYGNTGEAAINAPVAKAWSAQGFLVVAPEGLNRTWSHQGSPSRQRDEVAFVASVVEDVEARWPVAPNRRVATGFSQGGSMVWHLACFMRDGFTAYAPVAGAFWQPHPQTCPAAPVNLRHVHGTGDETVPMKGRPIRKVYHQGDVRLGIEQWLRFDGCEPVVDASSRSGILTCDLWRRCASGKQVELCLHAEGHDYRAEWVPGIVAWLESLPDWGG
jgi:polyhydroxybutyrate depolymerase